MSATRVTATDVWYSIYCYRCLLGELLLQMSDTRVTATDVWYKSYCYRCLVQELMLQMSDKRVTATDVWYKSYCCRCLIQELLLQMSDTRVTATGVWYKSYCCRCLIQELLLHMPDNGDLCLWEKNANTIIRQCFQMIIYATKKFCVTIKPHFFIPEVREPNLGHSSAILTDIFIIFPSPSSQILA
jgi:hypothetical protein